MLWATVARARYRSRGLPTVPPRKAVTDARFRILLRARRACGETEVSENQVGGACTLPGFYLGGKVSDQVYAQLL